MFPLVNDVTRDTCCRVIALIGNSDPAEMRLVCDWLNDPSLAHARTLMVYSSIAGRLAATDDPIPDLIVLLQYWSDEYSRAEIHQLLAFAPLARVVVCAGAWCESDGRNRDLWPQAVRVPIWAAIDRLRHEWQLICGQQDRSPLLWSASREEVFAFDASCEFLDGERKSVLVDSPDPAIRRYLSDALSAEKHQLEFESPSVILFDADPWDSSRANALNSVRRRWPTAEVCVVSYEAFPVWAGELHEQGIAQIRHKLGFYSQSGSLRSAFVSNR